MSVSKVVNAVLAVLSIAMGSKVNLLQKLFKRTIQIFRDRVYRRVLIGRALMYLLNKVYPEVESIVVKTEGRRLVLGTYDRSVSLYNLADPTMDQRTFAFIIEKLEKFHLNRSGHFFDIGANIGTSTISASKFDQFSQIHAFEPVPYNFEALERNVAINKLQDRIKIHSCALSDRPGTVEISLDPSNFGDNRIVSDITCHDDIRSKLTVSTKTLDCYLAEQAITAEQIALIWMDSQGHEGQIMAGAKALLAQKAVPFYVEFWPFGLRASKNDLLYREVVETYFSQIIDCKTGREYAATDIGQLFLLYQTEGENSDLLLIP